MVGVAVAVRHHAHDLVVLHLRVERAADAAIGAGRRHDAFAAGRSAISDFSVSATVGHASTHAPHDTHSDARNGSFWLAETFESKPRPWIVSANVPCTSSHARTQREQTMHIVGIEGEVGVARVLGSVPDGSRRSGRSASR